MAIPRLYCNNILSMPQDPVNWNERYATKDTPWDSGDASRELQRIVRDGHVKPCRMLEIGCGTGTNAIFLAQQGFDVIALDLSPLAIEQATSKAAKATVNVKFMVGDILRLPDLGPPFEFVFDRGVYHHLRTADLMGFLVSLQRVSKPGGFYLTLAGNANEVVPEGVKGGPPQVQAHDLCKELQPLFNLILLRAFRFDGVVVEGKPMQPLAWSALLRRK
jgi:SAM-dependent methyltransferase